MKWTPDTELLNQTLELGSDTLAELQKCLLQARYPKSILKLSRMYFCCVKPLVHCTISEKKRMYKNGTSTMEFQLLQRFSKHGQPTNSSKHTRIS